ncbi:MAG: hypothetical protein WBO54_05125 [Thermoanaerobaculia bacterium]
MGGFRDGHWIRPDNRALAVSKKERPLGLQLVEDPDHMCKPEIQTLCHQLGWQRRPNPRELSNNEVVNSSVLLRQGSDFASGSFG